MRAERAFYVGVNAQARLGEEKLSKFKISLTSKAKKKR